MIGCSEVRDLDVAVERVTVEPSGAGRLVADHDGQLEVYGLVGLDADLEATDLLPRLGNDSFGH